MIVRLCQGCPESLGAIWLVGVPAPPQLRASAGLFHSDGRKPFGFCLCPPKDELYGPDPSLSEELTSILNELTQLSKSEHCKVALRARQVGSWAAIPAPSCPSQCTAPLLLFSDPTRGLALGFSPVRLASPSPPTAGPDRLPPPVLRAEAQPGGVHFPVCHRHVWPPVLPREPQGEAAALGPPSRAHAGAWVGRLGDMLPVPSVRPHLGSAHSWKH